MNTQEENPHSHWGAAVLLPVEAAREGAVRTGRVVAIADAKFM